MKSLFAILFLLIAGSASAETYLSQHDCRCFPGTGDSEYDPGFGLIDNGFLVDASRDLVDALVYATRVAENEVFFGSSYEEAEDIRWFADRISNTRHYVDANVVNALRAGASPAVALRLLRDLDPNFIEILELAARLPGLSPELERALNEVFELRSRLISLLSNAGV